MPVSGRVRAAILLSAAAAWSVRWGILWLSRVSGHWPSTDAFPWHVSWRRPAYHMWYGHSRSPAGQPRPRQNTAAQGIIITWFLRFFGGKEV